MIPRMKFALGFSIALLLIACSSRQPERISVNIVADGETRNVLTEVDTVGQLLREANLTLAEFDRVRPGETSLLQEDLTVTITRVTQSSESITETIPFNTNKLTDASLEPGAPLPVQAGRNGERQLTYRITFEDGEEFSRELIKDEITRRPVEEILRVGIKDIFSTVPFEGSIAFISNQNAFIMRETASSRKPVTSEGDLDGLVFDLSPDGRWLIYTRALTDTLNTLWIANLSLATPEVSALDIEGVLWAKWSPDGASVAYSTAEPSAGPARWRAHNDLFIMPIDEGQRGSVEQILTENNNATYAWWGTTFAWSPGSDALAVADADGISLLELNKDEDEDEREPIRLVTYAPFNTRSNWAWVPTPSWSTDGQFIYFTRHNLSQTGRSEEDSERFDVYAVSRDGTSQIRLFNPAGMWSEPQVSPNGNIGIVLSQPEQPFESNRSRYSLFVLDRDGSNRRRIFPAEGQLGVSGRLDMDWSPDGTQIIVSYPTRPIRGNIQQGDLFLIDLSTGTSQQITTEGSIRLPRWSR